ncbi:hypothetical protein KY284_000693 [Solanum tuberosum]|nr:hypothetical protein KY284_000693 [Solanum tuberosum]
MVKFEYDQQEVIVHGEGDLSVYKDSSLSFIKANNENETLVYQAFKVVVVEHILKGNLILKPQLPMASVMMVNEILKHGFEPGKGLGIFLQGRVYLVSPRKSLARITESSESLLPEPVLEVYEELINYFQDLFLEVDMVELGEGTSDKDMKFIGPDVQLNNWEATPLPVKNESW